VIATITEPFNVSRFPLDEHLLTIRIENPLYQRHQMMFIPDLEMPRHHSELRQRQSGDAMGSAFLKVTAGVSR